MDFKYDILKHPNVKLTTDGGAQPYQHGEDRLSFASVIYDPDSQEKLPELEIRKYNYVLLSEEELEERINDWEEKHNAERKKQQNQEQQQPDDTEQG
jgi:type IV secretion system protein VirD4